MKSQNISKILEVLKQSFPEANTLSEKTKFADIQDFDSMSVVNFQMNLAVVLGDKVNEIAPLPEMTVEQYAEIIDSL